jgi:deoxyinosine 3'endonuclease (endonuclease V)
MSQEGHVRKKGVVSVYGTIFNTSNKGVAKHHINKTQKSHVPFRTVKLEVMPHQVLP